MSEIRNIGIFAHVDAGKTTLSERILAHAGVVREAGSVDEGTAHTDLLAIERRRGISVKSTCVRLNWRGARINLIDTPGHADFASEVGRAMWALDGAVLLVSAAEGVQPRTELLFEALAARGLPTLIFINKTDRANADPARALAEIRSILSGLATPLYSAEAMMECAAESDERALEDYLSGIVYDEKRLRGLLVPLARTGRAYPVLRGSALRDAGVPELLDAIVEFLPPPAGDAGGPLSALVFAVEQDRLMGRAAHARLFSGRLASRELISLRGEARKVTQIRLVNACGRAEDIGALEAGELGAIYGLGDVRVGDVLGDESLLPTRALSQGLTAPLMAAQILPEDESQLPALRKALDELESEDIELSVSWSRLTRKLYANIAGEIQLEALSDALRTRYGLNASFGPAEVIYRETISEKATGFVAYTMPKPCWAVLKFEIEPLPRGSGVKYESVVPVRDIMQRYQNQVRQALPIALKQGMLGWQVTDVKITLVGGEHHLIHTHPLDFVVATPMAIMDGLRRGGGTLLEPMLDLRFSVPKDAVGKLIGDMVTLRGAVLSSRAAGDNMLLTAEAPLSEARAYAQRLAVITGGRGLMTSSLKGYRECPLELGARAERRGVNPLDTAKYILAARSALDGGIFDF